MGKSTAEKALSLNLNRPLYGTIAEIGAGQEVARWFFKVGGAAGTIAKAMSAYDMTFSDEIYGPEESGRYVVESRLRRMLEHEYSLLETRLTEKENNEKYYFAFADTVAAKSYKYDGDCHGWMGLKFQLSPKDQPSQVILHLRMLDKTNLHQQESLGILGVNLIYACYNKHQNLGEFLASLMDGGLQGRVEINVAHFEGPLFKAQDTTKTSLLLMEKNLTKTLLMPHEKPLSHLAEEFYNKQLIVHRGRFTPPIQTDIDILKTARDHCCMEKTEEFCNPYLISERYYDPDYESFDDLLKTVKELKKCHQNIMVTRFKRTFQLTEYVAQFTSHHINVVFRANKIIEILENQKLTSLDQLARIFNERTRMYIYPVESSQIPDALKKDPQQELFNLSNYKASDLNGHLYHHLIQSGYIQELTNFDPELARWDSESCQALKEDDEKTWKNLLACSSHKL